MSFVKFISRLYEYIQEKFYEVATPLTNPANTCMHDYIQKKDLYTTVYSKFYNFIHVPVLYFNKFKKFWIKYQSISPQRETGVQKS